MEYEIIKLSYTLRKIRNLAVVSVSVFWNTTLHVYTNILCFQADKILLLTACKTIWELEYIGNAKTFFFNARDPYSEKKRN